MGAVDTPAACGRTVVPQATCNYCVGQARIISTQLKALALMARSYTLLQDVRTQQRRYFADLFAVKYIENEQRIQH